MKRILALSLLAAAAIYALCELSAFIFDFIPITA
jgi:hypothetical protein